VSDWSALRRAEEAGRDAARAYAQNPATAAASELGGFNSGVGVFTAAALRCLLALGASPTLVARLMLPSVPHRVRARVRRVLEKYAFWRGVRDGLADPELLRRLTRGAVVLMYHAVGGDAEPPSKYVVPTERFRRQMAWLRWTGRPVMTMAELIADLKAGRPPSAGAVVISFDDGYADNYLHALPILRKQGFSATVFVVSSCVGGSMSWGDDPTLRGRRLLTPQEVDALRAGGCEIGGHSKTHPSLVAISLNDQRDEIGGCRRDLEALSGHPVRTFAYPFGDFNFDVTEAVRESGYAGACCSRSGVNELGTPLFEIRRVEVRGTDPLWRFIVMAWTGRRPRPADGSWNGGRAVEQNG
jgi:peptidoglycan/xylan/chitin deacetylase (PgdA/CDA1 family)